MKHNILKTNLEASFDSMKGKISTELYTSGACTGMALAHRRFSAMLYSPLFLSNKNSNLVIMKS